MAPYDSRSKENITGNLSNPPNDKHVMNWNLSSSERFRLDSNIRHDETIKDTVSLQAEEKSNRNEKPKRHRHRFSGGFLLPSLIKRSSSTTSQSFHSFRQDISNRKNANKISDSHSDLNSQREQDYFTPKERFTGGSENGTARDNLYSKAAKIQPKSTSAISIEDSILKLNIDSAQIVNIALNLSQNRRAASSKTILLPTMQHYMADKTTDGTSRPSMQRFTTWNSSSKSGGTHHMVSRSLHLDPGASTIHVDSNSFPKHAYRYQFSPSTLARAEKAKTSIELMAQYRRLLQFVSPLKPVVNMTGDSGGTVSSRLECLENQVSFSVKNPTKNVRPLGRSYNLLQYIRNRKLRARISQSIDGEAQGFGDLTTVSKWVNDIANRASSSELWETGNMLLPEFPIKSHEKSTLDTSPCTGSVRDQESPVKVKRPRIDWIISPADLLADLYWLEQGDNKKLIEDRNGDTIYPDDHFRRPNKKCYKDVGSELWKSSEFEKKLSQFNLRIDTDNPGKNPLKDETETFSHSSLLRAHPNIYYVDNVNAIQYVSDNANRSSNRFHRRSRSNSWSLSSDEGLGRRLPRRSIRDKQCFATPLHENQMPEIATYKELSNRDYETELIKKSPGNHRSNFYSGPSQRQNTTDTSQMRKNFVKIPPPSFPFFDTPEILSRNSRDYHESTSDSTPPNSPQMRNKKLKYTVVGGSKLLSPQTPKFDLRKGDEKEDADNNGSITIAGLRSSPAKKPHGEHFFNTEKSASWLIIEGEKGKKGSVSSRRAKTDNERVSGIRGILKNVRNPVSRLGDFIWRKVVVSGNSDDSLDGSGPEDMSNHQTKIEEIPSARENYENVPPQEKSSAAKYGKEEIIQNDLPHLVPERSIIFNPIESSGRWKYINSQQNLGLQTKKGLSQLGFNEISPTPSLVQAKFVCSDSTTSECSSNHRPRSPSTSEANAHLNAILDVTNQPFCPLSASQISGIGIFDHTKNDKWWNYDHRCSTDHGLTTTRQLARVKTLLLSSGIKAKEIKRRAGTLKTLSSGDDSLFLDLAVSAQGPLGRDPTIQRHRLAAQVLSEGIRRSIQILNSTSEFYLESKINSISNRLKTLQAHLTEDLIPMTRTAVDEADTISRDLVTDHRIAVTQVADKITQMMQRRKARFRWLGRGGWFIVEWVLIGIMWWVWFVVVIVKIVLGIGKVVIRGVRWLFWL